MRAAATSPQLVRTSPPPVKYGINRMARYSIRKQSDGYVVLAGDQSILRVTSRRKAVKLVVDAQELLSVQSAVAAPDVEDADQSAVKEPKLLDDEERFP